MTNAGNKRLKLLLLTLAILACSVMALGGTLAGGVDRSEGKTAEPVPNNTPGNMEYQVDILCADSVNGAYQNLLNSTPFANALWCPGYTKVVYVKVQNREAFSIEATLDLKVTDNGFGTNMTYAVLSPNNEGKLSNPGNWLGFLNDSGDYNAVLAANQTYNVFDKVLLHPSQAVIYAVAIHMSEGTSNQYQGKSMQVKFDFRVDADLAPGTTPTATPNATPG